MNSHRQVVLVTIVVLVASVLSQPCAQQVNAQDLRMAGVRVKRSMLYTLQPGQPVFADREFAWQEISAELERHLAVRNQLEGFEPLEVAVKGPGRLLALLWVWDFGFVGDGPPEASNINGWQLLDTQAAHVEGYPWPLGLYARQMPAGRATVDLKDYMGQWIIVGFERELPAVRDAGRTLALALTGAKTRHNILNPDREATLQCAPGEEVDDRAGVICELFDEGKRLARFEGTGHVLNNEGINFALPDRPGRYWLQVGIKGTCAKTVLPLTIALPPIQDYASMEGFFPVGAWVAISGTLEESFSPDGKLTGELTTIDQVELGVNTFWAAKDAPFIEALNGRKILSARSTYINRTVAAEDPERAAGMMLFELRALLPHEPDVLAISSADEPLMARAEYFRLVEEGYRNEAPSVAERSGRPAPPLLYCLDGQPAGECNSFWAAAGSTIRQSRIYPIRKDTSEGLAGLTQIINYGIKVADIARSREEIPYWLVMQAFGQERWAVPTGGQVRLMVNLALARGTKGLSYFGYGNHTRFGIYGMVNYPFLPNDDRYAAVEVLGRKIWELRDLLPQLHYKRTLAQRDKLFDVQHLTDTEGADYLWVTNLDYDYTHEGPVQVHIVKGSGDPRFPVEQEVAAPGSLLVTVPGDERIAVDAQGEITVSLEPGAAQLFKVVGQ
ncbi:MAG: hypothetical protein KAW89_04885 [Armatimonadetes bacterium]|nr:hypothetical protein [Armatimonadota bacterium]